MEELFYILVVILSDEFATTVSIFKDITTIVISIITAFIAVISLLTARASLRTSMASLRTSRASLDFAKTFSFEKPLREKQFEVMMRLREVMLDTWLDFDYWDNEVKVRKGSSFALQHVIAPNFKDSHNNVLFGKKELLWQLGARRQLKFLSFTREQYLPPELRVIFDKFKNRIAHNFKVNIDENPQDKIAFILDYREKQNEELIGNKHYHTFAQFPTLESLVERIREIFDEMDNWFNKHNAKDVTFEFQRNNPME